jgi:hypothetical protein
MRKLLAAAALLALASCQVQNQCEFSFSEVCQQGDATCQAQLLDSTHWISGPQLGAWLPFRHNAEIEMHFRDGATGAQLTGAGPIIVTAYLAASAFPNDPDGGLGMVGTAGNLAEIVLSQDGAGWKAVVHNDTCADYYVWVVAEAL